MKQKEEILAKIKELIQKVEPNSEIILFGSRARGDEREDSDWDLLILIPSSANLKEEQKFRHKLFELELQYGLAISTFVHSKKDWENKHRITPLYQNIKQEGIRL
jgi:predicted nucleotidyltransferase